MRSCAGGFSRTLESSVLMLVPPRPQAYIATASQSHRAAGNCRRASNGCASTEMHAYASVLACKKRVRFTGLLSHVSLCWSFHCAASTVE